MARDIFSAASLTPTEVLAADSVEFVVRLTIGADYPDQPTRIVLDCMGMLGTSCPNTLVNEESGYVEAYVSSPDVTYRKACWDPSLAKLETQGSRVPREGQRMIVLDLSAGLAPGDTVELHWGETLGGFGPGAKVTSVVPRPDFSSTITVRFFETQERGMPDYARSYVGYQRPAPDAQLVLTYRILPRAPHHLRLLRKTDRALLVPYDVFWNVAEVGDTSELVYTEAPCTATRNEQGVFEYADRNIRVRPKSLPFTETPSMDDVHDGLNLYWGDLHTHSRYSVDCFTRSAMDMTPADLMAFARDRAGLDFFAVTDHHIPARDESRKLTRERWEATMQDVRDCDEPGRFLVFAGFEFSDRRGDTIAIFKWEPDYDEINRPEWQELTDLWRDLAGQPMMTIPHFHSPGALPEGEWRAPADSAQEPVLEIYSDHGSYEREDALENGRALCKRFRNDRCGIHFLTHGYRHGFVANSDDHKAHVGVSGLTAVFAPTLDKDAIWSAYQQRHVYGTTNARIRLVFTGNGRLMGDVIPNTSDKEFEIDVVGENHLKRVDVFRDGELYERFRPQGVSFKTGLAVADQAPSNWYVRVTQRDNHVAYSSPIWYSDTP